MFGYISRVALLTLVAMVLATGFLAVFWPKATLAALATAQAQQLSQRGTPHPIEGRADCLLCHASGGAKPVPTSHAGRTSATCLACHPVVAPVETKASPTEVPSAPVGAPSGTTQPEVTSQVPPPAGTKDNAACLACHDKPGMVAKIGGDELLLRVDAQAFAGSVHGRQLSCVDCHADKPAFPHAKTAAADARSYSVESAKVCLKCHQSTNEDFLNSVHGQALSNGKTNAATCTDCHTAHAVQKSITLTYSVDSCVKCHSKVVESYRESVHGRLVAAGRKDAANCSDCHTRDGVAHKVKTIETADPVASGKQVAETCGKCHTKVAENYVSTFHGKAMRLGVSGAAPTCVDCHGAYGVQRVHGPEAPLTAGRRAQTCAKCHEGANESFAAGWIGHDEPSPSWFPLVFITERFLFYLTTTVVAFGIIHVELDFLRWFVSGRKKGKSEEVDNNDRSQ